MAHPLEMALVGSFPRQGACRICGISAASIRMAWAYPCGVEVVDDGQHQDQDLLMLCREEVIQRQFLRTSEQYLKGEHDDMPLLGAWRRKPR